MKNLIFATAGHVDHGKTVLIRKLTGIDTDRWKEEKRRGITIDLGYAYLDQEDIRIHFIDVPGHERFVRNMLAGAGTVSATLFVVAADEGIKPQTVEHYQICRLLGLNRGVVAISKIDLVDDKRIKRVAGDLRSLFRGSFLGSAPFVPVSAKSGDGIDTLKAILHEIAGEAETPEPGEVFRLPVDRSFNISGYGTVVTGSLIQGTVSKGDEVEIQPGGLRFTIRNIQVFGEERDETKMGERAALNLQRAKKDDLKRGDILTNPLMFDSSKVIEVEIEMLGEPSELIGKDDKVKFYHLSGEHVARLKLLEGESENRYLGRMFFEEPVFVFPGDRFILRRLSPVVTIAGGVVVNNNCAFRRDEERIGNQVKSLFSDPSALIWSYIAEAGLEGISVSLLRKMTGWETAFIGRLLEDLTEAGKIISFSEDILFADSAIIGGFSRNIVKYLESYHAEKPDRAGVSKSEIKAGFPGVSDIVLEGVLESLTGKGIVETTQSLFALPVFAEAFSGSEIEFIGGVEKVFKDSGLKAPSIKEISEKILVEQGKVKKAVRILSERGSLIVVSSDFFLHDDVVRRLIDDLGHDFGKEKVFSITSFKDKFDLSRKYAIPILEYLDRSGITERLPGGSRKIR